MSLINMGLGAIAIFLCLSNGILIIAGWPDAVTLASSLIVVCMVLDGLDGALARRFGGSRFGRRMDSAADFISFCLVPAALLWAAYFVPDRPDWGSNALCVAVAFCFAGAGLKRLVDFTREGYKRRRFTGLATPAAAFAALVMVHVLPRWTHLTWGLPSPATQLVVLGLVAALMVAPVEYPKIKGVIGAALAAGFCAAIGYLALRKTAWPMDEDALFAQYRVLSILGLALILLYATGGALYAAATEGDGT